MRDLRSGVTQVGFLFLNAAFAQWGGMGLELLLRRLSRWFFPVHSKVFLVLTDCLFAALAAAMIAISLHLVWRLVQARWAWVLFLLWFGSGAAFYLLVAAPHGPGSDFWKHFSGFNCALRGGRAACYDFFIFTVPLLRGVSYSLTAWLLATFFAELRLQEPAYKSQIKEPSPES